MKFTKDWILLSLISLCYAIFFSSFDFLLVGRPGLIFSTLLPFFVPNMLWMGLHENLLIGVSVLVIYSLPLYLVFGLFSDVIYKILQKKFSIKKAFWVTVGLMPIIIVSFTGVKIYLDDLEYRQSNYLDKTPANCTALEDGAEKLSCYRSMYRKNSVPEVCLYLINLEGEATECARRYGAQSGEVSACSIFKEEYLGNNQMREIFDYPNFQEKLHNNCLLGATFIKKDKDLCKQLPLDDGFPEYSVLSTQESCLVMIDYWENNVNFYLHPETSEIYSKHIWDIYIKQDSK